MVRRDYDIKITVNDINITKVIIDPHYEENHGESISDEIIIDLVKTLDGEYYEPDDVKAPFNYFVKDGINLNGKLFRLIWLLEDHEIYIGVVNAYRR